jgi:hypothetical protein
MTGVSPGARDAQGKYRVLFMLVAYLKDWHRMSSMFRRIMMARVHQPSQKVTHKSLRTTQVMSVATV